MRLLLVLAVLIGVALYLYFSIYAPSPAEIEREFIAGIPNIFRTPGGNLEFIREQARKTVAEFVRAWLLQRRSWGERKIENIRVIFREEGDLQSAPPTPAIEIREMTDESRDSLADSTTKFSPQIGEPR